MRIFHKHTLTTERTNKFTTIYCKTCGDIIHQERIDCKHDWIVITKLVKERVEQYTKTRISQSTQFDNHDNTEYENIIIKVETCVLACALCGETKEF